MALDAQRNWDTQMAESLSALKNRNSGGGMPLRSITVLELPKRKPSSASENGDDESSHEGEPLYLPDEILLHILDYVRLDTVQIYQPTLSSCCLLSRQWYEVAVPLLYERPRIEGKGFDPFVRAICPSINLHVRQSPLAQLVKVLDMGHLVHHGSNSKTARLLGRTKNSLEEFVAPQATFAINCYPALSKCVKLRVLDLSLVSESTPLQKLFNTIKLLPALETLRLPRSAGFGNNEVDPDSIVWPPNLQRLYLSGGIDAHFLCGIVNFPPTLSDLTIEHCSQAKGHAIRQLLATMSVAGVPLRSLKIASMPRFGINALDVALAFFPGLEHLSVSVDYITPAILNPEFQLYQSIIAKPDFTTHALRSLEITNSGSPGDLDKFSPIDIVIALEEGSFPNLRIVRVAKSLEWGLADTRQEMDALDEQLLELELKDYQERRGIYLEVPTDEWKQIDWRKNAGVWLLEA
ncbi:hypothetical protein AAFC00_005724 [Neodothiora populina]|uniref:F-box domain-containing protein n=1 Tax=Neodothiora populina TaxID=2781224 RepID=A0ABR3P6Z2_9PEZI